MQTAVLNNGLGKGQKAIRIPKTKKSLFELAQTIPDGRYKGLSKILESHEIPKDRK